MARLNPSDAVRLLFAGMTAELETDDGTRIPMQATGMKGAKVWATAPRLAVATGMTVRGRIIVPEEVQPWLVRFTVEDASFHTNELARVRLRAMAVGPDQSRRKAQRVPAGGVAWLIAVSCRDVVDGDRVEGTIVDLSESGVAFATRRVLRIKDRLIFNGRFFTEHVEAEVRVTSLRDAEHGRVIAGCAFLDINAAQLSRVRRLIAAAEAPPEPPAAFEIGALREAVGEVDNPGWRGLFRRS
jgi:hypothetical protein